MYEEEARRFLVESAGRLNLLTPREVEDGLSRALGGIGGPIQWALREGVLMRPVLRAMLGQSFLRGAETAGLLDAAAVERLGRLAREEAEHLDATRATRIVAERSDAAPTRIERAATPPGPEAPPAWLGGYRLVRPLGVGGMARVYLAEKDGESFAVKILLPEVAARPEYLRRFEREGNVAGRLRHPNVVRVHRAGVERGTAYLVLEYVPGRTLAEAVRGRLPLSPPEAVETVLAIAEALVHAHSRGVLHRDVKPENVLVREDGRLQLADFGLVKEIGRVVSDRGDVFVTEHQIVRIEELFRTHLLEVMEKRHLAVDLERRLGELRRAIRTAESGPPVEFSIDSLSRLREVVRPDDLTRSLGVTRTGECLGTPLYMSPEQYAGRLTDGRTDVFSLGVLYYYLLTGRHPWRGGDLEEVGRLKLTEDPVPPDRVAANVPTGHAAVCLKMLARHPEARYPTVRFAQLDLVRLAQGETPHLSPPSWWDEAVAARAPAGENRTEAYEFLTGLWLEFLSIVRFVEDADAENEEIP